MAELIDRQRLLAEIRSLRNRLVLSAQSAEKLESVVNSIPAATGVDGNAWMPVSEKPHEAGYYIVWTRNTGIEKCRWSERNQRWMGGMWTNCITHWKPMPMGPKETTGEN